MALARLLAARAELTALLGTRLLGGLPPHLHQVLWSAKSASKPSYCRLRRSYITGALEAVPK